MSLVYATFVFLVCRAWKVLRTRSVKRGINAVDEFDLLPQSAYLGFVRCVSVSSRTLSRIMAYVRV
jgi:hypothetical protein